jgi:hypothetical protein
MQVLEFLALLDGWLIKPMRRLYMSNGNIRVAAWKINRLEFHAYSKQELPIQGIDRLVYASLTALERLILSVW